MKRDLYEKLTVFLMGIAIGAAIISFFYLVI